MAKQKREAEGDAGTAILLAFEALPDGAAGEPNSDRSPAVRA